MGVYWFVLCVQCLFSCPSSGELIKEKTALCHNDPNIYRCSNFENGFISGEIELRSGKRHPFSYNRREASLDENAIALGTSAALLRVNFTESFISVTFVFPNSVDLNGTMLTCNGQSLFIAVTSIKRDYSSSPVRVILRPTQVNMDVANFTMEWVQGLPTNITDTMLSLDPPPPHEPQNIESTMLTSLSLLKSSEYTIMFSWDTCQQRVNRSFLFGGCPFLLNSSTVLVLQYVIEDEGYLVEVQCNQIHNTTRTLRCLNSGRQWNTSVTDLCGISETGEEEVTDSTIPTCTDGIKVITDGRAEFTIQNGLPVSTLAVAVTCSAVIPAALAFVIGILIGRFWGFRDLRKLQQQTEEEADNIQDRTAAEEPIYNEVKLEENIYNLSNNEAYDVLKK